MEATNRKFFEANILNPPTIKAGITGATILHNHQYLTRYRGSKKYNVLPSGKIEPKPVKIARKKDKPSEHRLITYRVNKSEISKRIHAIINTQKGTKSLFFYTISFPNQVTDDLAYKILNSFLTTIRTAFSVKQYIWITERNRQGTIHFHLAMPYLFKPKQLNATIRNLLHFYIRKGKLNWSHISASKYNGLDLAKDPKTRKVTNFAAINNGRKLASYLTKYCSKGNGTFNRQAWQASKQVLALFTEILINHDEAELYLTECIDRENPIFIDTHFCYYRYLKSPPDFVSHFLADINRTVCEMGVN